MFCIFSTALYMTFWKVWKSVQIGQMDLTEFLHLMISLPVVELKVKAVSDLVILLKRFASSYNWKLTGHASLGHNSSSVFLCSCKGISVHRKRNYSSFIFNLYLSTACGKKGEIVRLINLRFLRKRNTNSFGAVASKPFRQFKKSSCIQQVTK